MEKFELQDFFKRIDLNIELDAISKDICRNYNLGLYVSQELIPIGYEDFNYILNTSINKYCVKIFSKERTKQEIIDYIDRMENVTDIGINFPSVIKINNKSLYELTIKDVTYKICVFEHIDGKNYLELQTKPTIEELKEIARQMAILHKIDYKPNFTYDTWAIINFKQEYEKKHKYIESEYLKPVYDLYGKFKNLDISQFPYAFTHGDIISTNVMKDINNKLWIIDFSVSNYLPRIIDLVVTSCNLCLIEDNKEETYSRIKVLLDEYRKHIKLTEIELNKFQLFFDFANAMHVLSASYQKGIGNTSEENEYWLNEGKIGLQQSDAEKFNEILKWKE